MTEIGFISDMPEIVKAPWRLFQHDGVAASQLSERWPLPPALSAKDLPGGRTPLRNGRQIRTIDCHPAESDEDSAPEIICNTENWVNWNGNLDNNDVIQDDWEVDDNSDIVWHNGTEDPEGPAHRVVSATPIVPGFIRPTQRSKKQVEKGLMIVSAMETRRNKGNKTK